MTDDYTVDTNQNGIPDAFEHHVPIAEALEFISREPAEVLDPVSSVAQLSLGTKRRAASVGVAFITSMTALGWYYHPAAVA